MKNIWSSQVKLCKMTIVSTQIPSHSKKTIHLKSSFCKGVQNCLEVKEDYEKANEDFNCAAILDPDNLIVKASQ